MRGVAGEGVDAIADRARRRAADWHRTGAVLRLRVVAGVALGIARLDHVRRDDRDADGAVHLAIGVGIVEGAGIAGVVAVPLQIVEVPAVADPPAARPQDAESVQILLPGLVVGSLRIDRAVRRVDGRGGEDHDDRHHGHAKGGDSLPATRLMGVTVGRGAPGLRRRGTQGGHHVSPCDVASEWVPSAVARGHDRVLRP